MPKYSIVVPFHNEQESVTALYDRLKAVMEATGDYWRPVVRHEAPFDLVGMKGPHLRAVAAVC